jgi:nicotinate phosphoribosyltransferase
MGKIIASRLDNDFYNFTMGQLAWRYFADVEVSYKLTQRDDFDLTKIDLGRLVAEIERVQHLGFTVDEIDYLRSLDTFNINYLNWLAMDHQLPPVKLTVEDGQVSLTYKGSWADAIFWETPLLAIVSELGMQAKMVGSVKAHLLNVESHDRLEDKIILLADHEDVKFMEFGTRRRFSYEWQEYVIQRMRAELPDQVLGTSNVHIARVHGFKPLGTMAHQLFMVATALSADPERATNTVLNLFEADFGHRPELLTYLPDTYGTDAGLRYFTAERAERWAGIRQDSGEPFEIVQKILDFYWANDIDSTTKTLIPSDGLDIPTAIRLQQTFGQHCKMVFGIGTNLTNDTGLKPLNIVVKPERANGEHCVKLSDTPGKVTGDPFTATHIALAVQPSKVLTVG